MTTKEEIDTAIAQIKSRKQLVQHLKENPFFIEWTKLKEIMKNGQYLEQTIANEEGVIKVAEQQTGQMIHQFKQQSNDALGNPIQQQPQQPQPVPQQQVPEQIQQAPEQVQQVPEQVMPQPSIPPMPEEQAPPFDANKEDLGIDEEMKFEGLPEFDDEK